MASIKLVCMQVAVAGVVAGGGSAVAAAVASAESGASDSTPSAGASPSDSGRTTGPPARSRARAAAAPAPAAAATGGSTVTVLKNTPTNNERSRASLRGKPAVYVRPITPVPRRQAATTPAAADVAAEAPMPAPAAPAPASVPVMPVLPAAPASAGTVTGSAATTRRAAPAAATVQLVDTPTHVLLLGVDGANLSKILEYTYDEPDSGFRAVMDEGITAATSLVGHTTISGPSW